MLWATLTTTYSLRTVLHGKSQKQSRGSDLVYSERKLTTIFKVIIINEHSGAAISSKFFWFLLYELISIVPPPASTITTPSPFY